MIAAFLSGMCLRASIAYAMIGNSTVATYLSGLCAAFGMASAWKLADSQPREARQLRRRLHGVRLRPAPAGRLDQRAGGAETAESGTGRNRSSPTAWSRSMA